MARISPAAKDEWAPDLTAFIAEFRSAVKGDRNNEGRPGGANLLGTLARYPELAKAFLAFNGHFLYGSTLSARQRELLILRVATVRGCDYEWAQHVLLGGDAGLQPEEIARIAGGSSTDWIPLERVLLQAADELLTGGRVDGGTWQALAAELDERQLMDVVFTVGTYELLAKVLLSFEVEPEADLRPYISVGR